MLVGDFIRVKSCSNDEDVWYEGCVHEILADFVSVRFSDAFSVFRGPMHDIRFVLNRISIRRMHHALSNKNDPPRLLFPEAKHLIRKHKVTPAEIRELVPINRDIGEDNEQLEAVTAIVHRPPGDVPFILFGP